MPTPATKGPVLSLEGVGRVVDGVTLLRDVDWDVGPDERWVVIGPNGGGKSTLVAVAALRLHPSTGRVTVLGHELGTTDLRSLRSSIGISAAGLVDDLRGSLTAEEVVRCGLHGALEPWWHRYDDADTERAVSLLDRLGVGHLADRSLRTLSSGERQRVLLARSLMSDPAVVFLDEPTAGLDFAGREDLVASLDRLADDGPTTVLVTHHLEDVPTRTTHVLAVADGTVMAAGPIEEVLDEMLLERLFGIPVRLTRADGRWSARADVR